MRFVVRPAERGTARGDFRGGHGVWDAERGEFVQGFLFDTEQLAINHVAGMNHGANIVLKEHAGLRDGVTALKKMLAS